MPKAEIHGVGQVGVIADLRPYSLPPEAWSSVQNVRFLDGVAEKIGGEIAVFDPPTVPPYWALGVPGPSNYFTIYMGLAKGNLFAAGSHFDITRSVGGDYTGGVDDFWNGGVFGGIPVITNGIDKPQFFSPLATSTDLADLTNWPAADLCKLIRPYKNFLVAMNMTTSSNPFPHRVKWSTAADPGSLPGSWDETDATTDAGLVDLSDTESGEIDGAVGLGDIMVIYKNQSTHGMQFVGGRAVMRFFPILGRAGILGPRCATIMPNGTQHFVATGEDFIVHNGIEAESIADRKVRRLINNTIDTANYRRSFVVSNPTQQEIWFCYPEVGSTHASKAMLWNYKDNTIGFRDLDDAAYMARTVIDESVTSETWDSDTDPWYLDLTPWDEKLFDPLANNLLQCAPTRDLLLHIDTTNQIVGMDMQASAERLGLGVVGSDRFGQPKVAFGVRKLVTRLWPKLEGGPIEVQVGSQETPDSPVVWEPKQPFDSENNKYIDFCVNTPFLAVRFSSNADVTWKLYGYDLEIVPVSVL